MKVKKAFTLIELLVVISIIGILASVLMVSMTSATNSANDAKRKADVNQIVKSLFIYSTSNSTYPVSSTPCNIGNNCPAVVNTALGSSINARDPKSGSYYTYWSDGENFVVNAVMSDLGNFTYSSSVEGYVSQIKTSCKDILDDGLSTGSDVYYIDPNGGDSSDKFKVYCDMTTDGGGWTIIFRSSNPSIWKTNNGTPGAGSWSLNMVGRTPLFSSIMVRKVSDGLYKTMTGFSTYDIYSVITGTNDTKWNGTNSFDYNGYHLGLYTASPATCVNGTTVIVGSTCNSSWGFGHRQGMDDYQGYIFGNQNGNIGTTVFDIGLR